MAHRKIAAAVRRDADIEDHVTVLVVPRRQEAEAAVDEAQGPREEERIRHRKDRRQVVGEVLVQPPGEVAGRGQCNGRRDEHPGPCAARPVAADPHDDRRRAGGAHRLEGEVLR